MNLVNAYVKIAFNIISKYHFDKMITIKYSIIFVSEYYKMNIGKMLLIYLYKL